MSWKSAIRSSSSSEWFNFSIYAELIHAVVLLFWCVSLKGSQVGPLYLGLMRWVNSWANANLFSDTRWRDESPSFSRLFSPPPPTLTKGRICTTLKFRGSLHLLECLWKVLTTLSFLIFTLSLFSPLFSYQQNLDFRAYLTRRWHWLSFLRSHPSYNIKNKTGT